MRRPDRLAGLSSAWDAAKSSRRVSSPARAWGINLRGLPQTLREVALRTTPGRGGSHPRGTSTHGLPAAGNHLLTEFFVRDLEPGDRGRILFRTLTKSKHGVSTERPLLFGNLHPAHRKETTLGDWRR